MNFWTALKKEASGMKARGGYSTDLIALCRLAQRMGKSAPRNVRREAGLAILEEFERFGSYYEPFERLDTCPGLKVLGVTPDDLVEIRKRRTAEERAMKIAAKVAS